MQRNFTSRPAPPAPAAAVAPGPAGCSPPPALASHGEQCQPLLLHQVQPLVGHDVGLELGLHAQRGHR